jgi:hypothetical protein
MIKEFSFYKAAETLCLSFKQGLSDGSERTEIHSVVLSSPAGNYAQIIFSGDKLLDLSGIQRRLGDDGLLPDRRLSIDDASRSEAYVRVSPLLPEQNVPTFICDDLFERSDDLVHFPSASSSSGETSKGAWLLVGDLKALFPEARPLRVTSEAHELDRVNLNPDTIRPLLFSSTLEEISLLCEEPKLRLQCLSSLLETDSCLLFPFLVFCAGEGLDLSKGMSIDDLLFCIGEVRCRDFLLSLSEDESFVVAEDFDMSCFRDVFSYTAVSGVFMRHLAACGDRPDLDANLVGMLSRLPSALVLVWVSCLGSSERLTVFFNQMLLNRHRGWVEVQNLCADFSYSEAASVLIKQMGLPDVYMAAVEPQERFQSDDYSALMIISHGVLQRAGFARFRHVEIPDDFTNQLIISLNVSDCIEKALEKVHESQPLVNLLHWRYKPKDDAPKKLSRHLFRLDSFKPLEVHS